MAKQNSDLKSKAYRIIRAGDPSAVWTAADFASLGSRDAVDKALQRLVLAGDLRRIDRGLYDRTTINRLTGKPAPPDYRAVIDAVARRDQTRILVDGMTAANDLGLSDAVPGRIIVHSDARHKSLNLGNQIITFRPTSASKLYWANRPAMRLVQALHWLKPQLDNPDDTQRIRRRIESLLSDSKQGVILRNDLKRGLSALPAWMQDFLREPIAHKYPTSSKPTTRKPRANHRKAPAT
jgi:hypothetical protein